MQKHYEMAIIYNNETRWRSNKGKVSITNPSIPTPDATMAEYNNAINNGVTAKEKLDDPMFSLKNLLPNFEDNPNSNTEFNQYSIRYLKTVEKMAPLIEELDELLTKYKQP